MPSINAINNTISSANFTVPAGTIVASGDITSSAGSVVGTTGIGAGAHPGISGLVVNLPNRIGAWITGPNISAAGVDADGLFIDTSFEPTLSIGKAASIGLYPTFNPPGGVVITEGYGLYVASGTQGGAGSVTTGYGLFVTHPTFGTANYAAQIDNIRIDVNTISATNLNGTLDVNSAGVGTISIGTNATAHSTIIGSTTAAATTTIQAPSAGVILTGVQGVAVANKNYVTINTATGAIGSDAGTVTSISITGNSGGALTGAAFTFTGGTTGLTFAGAGTTETLTGTLGVANGGTGTTGLTGIIIGNGGLSPYTASTVTQYGTLVAGTSNTVSSVAPSATSGIPFISQGNAANPTFGTAVVAGGGTGNTTFTAYSVITAGTTATGAFQNVVGVGTLGQLLVSQGAGALPVWTTSAATTITITGDTGGALTSGSFTFSGGTTGLSFGGSGSTETLTFAGITANGGTVSLATDATTSTINVGTGAGVKTSTFGSTNTTSATTLQAGSGALSISGTGTLGIQSATGAMSISTDASATTVNIATGGAVKTVTLGSTNTTSATTVQSGSGALNITSTNGAQTHNSGTGVMGISTDASATTVNIATGGAVKTLTLGSTNTTSATTLQNGSGALAITSTNGTITMNSGTGTLAIASDATAQTVNIATGGGAKVVTLGTTNTSSSLALKYGTADFTLASATGTVMSALDTGEITYPLQSAFLAFLPSQDSNVTGNNTSWRLGSTTALTEVFDQNSDFNTNGTFTAPVTGKYVFHAHYFVQGLTIANDFQAQIATSNRNYQLLQDRGAGNFSFGQNISNLCDMDAADTSVFNIKIAGEAANTADIYGDATDLYTSFCGYLQC
jgi:hypothetical protein